MKILIVTHNFLPAHPAGTEIYTFEVGRKLQALGHDVHIFTTEKDISRPNLSVLLRDYHGLPVHELTNNLFYNEFSETWDYPPVERTFARLVDDLKPDMVHFMHLLYLSVGCVEEVAWRGIPVVYTLHDYWLQCARYGQRIHADKSICHVIDSERCGECLSTMKFKQTRAERAVAKVIAQVRTATGVNLGPAARSFGNRLKGRAGTKPPRPPQPVAEFEGAPQLAEEVRRRDQALRERLLPVVYRFLAPSRFLRERFLEWGIPSDQIDYLRTGIDLEPFAGFERVPGDGLRVGFIGTPVPHKGVHVLLRAWNSLPPERRAKGSLIVYGNLTHNPAYVLELQRLADQTGVPLAGGLKRPEVRGAMAEIDLLVVPSVWYENSPLIILEAMATRTPLLVSDLGGMAELVEEGVSGYHFRVGDEVHLAEMLGRFLENQGELDHLYPDELPVQSVAFDAERLQDLYVEALEAASAPEAR